MDLLRLLVLVASFTVLIVGFTDPRKVVFGELEPTRRTVFSLYGGIFTLAFAWMVAESILGFFGYLLVTGMGLGFIAALIDPTIFSQKWRRKLLLQLWGGGILVSLLFVGFVGYWMEYGIDSLPMLEEKNPAEQVMLSHVLRLGEDPNYSLPANVNAQQRNLFVSMNEIGLQQSIGDVRDKFSDWRIFEDQEIFREIRATRNGVKWSLFFDINLTGDSQELFLSEMRRKLPATWEQYQQVLQSREGAWGTADSSRTPDTKYPFYYHEWETKLSDSSTEYTLTYSKQDKFLIETVWAPGLMHYINFKNRKPEDLRSW